MPFTFAHPAAVLPLLRPLDRYALPSALVVGSIAPDLTFFVPLVLPRTLTHGLAGLLLFCLPAGLLAWLMFHVVLKEPLMRLLPDGWQRRLAPPASPAIRLWPALPVSLLCGAATHLVWDSFTHPGTVVMDALPVLQTILVSLGGYQLSVFKLLQHASSVAGLSLLAWWLRRWLQRTPAAALPSLPMARHWRVRWLGAIGATSMLAAGWAAIRHMAGFTVAGATFDLAALQSLAAAMVFTGLPALTAALIAYSGAWQLWARR